MDIVSQHRSQQNYSSCYQLKQNKLLPKENVVSWDVSACKIHKIASGKGSFLANTTSIFLAIVLSK